MTMHDLFALKPLLKFLVTLVSFFIALRTLWKHPLAGPWFVVRFMAAIVTYIALGLTGILAMYELARPPAPTDVALAVGGAAICWVVFSCSILVRYIRHLQSMSSPSWLPWFEMTLLAGVCTSAVYVIIQRQL
jgi:hypothetical protein